MHQDNKPLVTTEEVVEQAAALQTQQGQPTPAIEDVPERPTLAPKVELIGELQGSGYKDRQWIIQRGERFVQVTELLYRVAEQLDGEHTLEEVAAGVTEATEWMVSVDNVRQIIEDKLIPLGLVATLSSSSGASSGGEHSQPRGALSLSLRIKVLGPQYIDPITKVLQVLYAPPILVPVLVAIAFAHVWLYSVHGIMQSILETVSNPVLILAMIPIMLASSVFHEFGHAAALRYGGGKVRSMGAGMYLYFPALYTDTTDSYRLGRWGRVRTDLGGFYFHLIFALGLISLYLVTGWEFLLMGVLTISGDIVYQCLPFVRFDGYWALTDFTGIPDLFSQMGAFLRSVLPIPHWLPIAHWKGSKLPNLKTWVKVVFATYIAITVPVLGVLFFLLVSSLPITMSTIISSLLEQARAFNTARLNGDFASAGLSIVQSLLLELELFGIPYLIYKTSRKPIEALWNRSKATPMRRIAGVLTAVSILALLAFLWVPYLGGLPI